MNGVGLVIDPEKRPVSQRPVSDGRGPIADCREDPARTRERKRHLLESGDPRDGKTFKEFA
jgi:hypothetical protein